MAAAPPNTLLENPLSATERELAADVLADLADAFREDPVDPELDIDLDEQARRAEEFCARTDTTASALRSAQIGFEEASHARNLLNTLTGEPGPDSDPDETRTLREATAKLHALCEAALPARRRAYLDMVNARAAIDGFMVQHVMGQGEPLASPPFSYTIGLAEHAHPELVCVGLAAGSAHVILDTLARRVLEGTPVLKDTSVVGVLADGLPVRAVASPELLCAQLHLARAADGSAPDALQILWPDPDGRLPGEPGMDAEMTARQQFPDHPE